MREMQDFHDFAPLTPEELQKNLGAVCLPWLAGLRGLQNPAALTSGGQEAGAGP
eukprot:CAMPEP_0171133446 /NCGR_PEP_ID=MMETSP0766_2-20121228/126332_1 /TAXON_ID=439317 /ORGANISM="Gambierdiscus australes, Strain CAWD 149" /LENGTH=53 /DNA_ID=CAMNT_0011596831 /DNA_START=18 /DNA_END=178 /DNA_ORIENTATION=-